MKSKGKAKHFIGQESIESKRVDEEVKVDQFKEFKKTPGKVLDSMWRELIKKSITETVPQQILAKESAEHSRTEADTQIELVEGEEFSIQATETEGIKIETREHLDYFRREITSTETVRLKKEGEKDMERYNLVLCEIKKIVANSKQLERHVKTIVTEVMPQNPGKYHSSFLEWVLIQLKNARRGIDESLSWSTMFSNRKQQKNLWGKAKKGGFINVVLSGERTASTQIA